MTRRKLPPFARELRKMRALHTLDNPLKNAHVHCGNHAWERARTYIEGGAMNVAHLVYPSDSEPGDFKWTCLAGLTVTILHNSDGPNSIYPPTLEQLAELILTDGARCVYVIDPKWPVQTHLRKDTAA